MSFVYFGIVVSCLANATVIVAGLLFISRKLLDIESLLMVMQRRQDILISGRSDMVP